MSIGLALSGGGFRATLFHLGVIRSLRDADRLQDVTHICSVSGGSVIAAHLVLNWERYTGTLEQYREAEAEILAFTKRDVRGRILRRLPNLVMVRVLRWIPPFRWIPHLKRYPRSRNALFQRELDRRLYHNRQMHSLPDHPTLFILVTNMNSGGLCSFTQAGYSFDFVPKGSGSRRLLPSVNLPVSVAVASSAALPAMFQPQNADHEIFGVDKGEFGNAQRLIDGGVYDNLGVRKLIQLATAGGGEYTDAPGVAQHDRLVISDASAAFDEHAGTTIGTTGLLGRVRTWISKETFPIFRTAVRAADILMKRIYDQECERLEGLQGAQDCSKLIHIRISDTSPKGVLEEAVQKQAKLIRTDLDRFSREEQAVLVSHGQDLGRAAFPEKETRPSEKERDFCEKAKQHKLVRSLQKGHNRRLGILGLDWILLPQLVGLLLLVLSAFWVIPQAGRLIETARNAILPPTATIVVGGKTFEESSILLEIMAQLIEASGAKVERRHYYGNNVELYYDLFHGDLDVYAEYSGTLLAVHLRAPMEDVRDHRTHTLDELNSRLLDSDRASNLQILPAFGFSNSYEMVMLRSRAEELGLIGPGRSEPTLDDLAKLSRTTELKFGLTSTFITRPDCMYSLKEAYAINFGIPDDTAHELKPERLERGEIDVSDFYETDTEDLDENFIVLRDNRDAWPLYEAAPFVRRDFAASHPQAIEALEKIAGRISRSEMETLVREGKDKGAVGRKLANDGEMQLRLKGIVTKFLQDEGVLGEP